MKNVPENWRMGQRNQEIKKSRNQEIKKSRNQEVERKKEKNRKGYGLFEPRASSSRHALHPHPSQTLTLTAALQHSHLHR
jgi:hypothetical protein